MIINPETQTSAKPRVNHPEKEAGDVGLAADDYTRNQDIQAPSDTDIAISNMVS